MSSAAKPTDVSLGLIGGVIVMGLVCVMIFMFIMWKLRTNKKAIESENARILELTEACTREQLAGEKAVEEAEKGVYCVRL